MKTDETRGVPNLSPRVTRFQIRGYDVPPVIWLRQRAYEETLRRLTATHDDVSIGAMPRTSKPR